MNHWKLDIHEMLATLALNTGKRGNRLTPDTFAELNEVLMSLDLEKVRGLILMSDGSNFSQGFDLSFLLTTVTIIAIKWAITKNIRVNCQFNQSR